MELATLQERLAIVLAKRESLKKLLELPGHGTLTIDIESALAELDELISDFKRTFPDLDIPA
ncbi:hypothetical protein [Thermosynechococcus sp. M55_K2018_012]|uniref:hypothetical protein n=1 Tax=Thermosynechococcus sp. M55_K2018_012 TaxID=2747809 RepID=UPI0019D9A30B|nr:hypothetical protein [Thermosynechococcus sp. M55_K2018_012]HIK48169.1 hypothetical protein [Thermosynechococcus sp. M55_K2018_012]